MPSRNRLLRLQRRILIALVILLPTAALAQAFTPVAQENPNIRVEQLAAGLGVPWGMTFLDDRRLLITERAGRVRLFDLESKSMTEVRGLPEIGAIGQGVGRSALGLGLIMAGFQLDRMG